MINKNTLWTFGDSYTFGFACREDCPSGKASKYIHEYRKDGDDIWPKLLSNDLNFNLKNFGKNAYCNYDIIESIIENIEDINENDIVVIFKTLPHRIKHPKNNKWEFIPNDELLKSYKTNKGYENFTIEEIRAIISYWGIYVKEPAIKNRQNKIFDYLISRIENDKKGIVLVEEVDFTTGKYESIKEHTNGNIYDYHFSWNGHYDFYRNLKSKLDKKII